MTELEDPPRLSEAEDGSELARALGAAKRDVPSQSRLDAIFAALPSGPPGTGGPSGDGGGSSGPSGGTDAGPSIAPAAVAKTALLTKGAVGIGTVLVIGALGYGLVAGPRAPETSPTSSAIAINTPSIKATSAVRSTTTTQATSTVVEAPSSTASSAASVAPLPTPHSGLSAAPSSSAAIRPESEILREAQAALGSNPARALSLANEHAQSWPNGSLGQERDMIKIQSLLALGRRDEARRAADAFKASHPSSAYNQRIDDLFR